MYQVCSCGGRICTKNLQQIMRQVFISPRQKQLELEKRFTSKSCKSTQQPRNFKNIFQPQKQHQKKEAKILLAQKFFFFFVKRILVNKLRIHAIFQKFCMMALWKDPHGRQSLIHKRISCVTSFPRQRNLEHLFFFKSCCCQIHNKHTLLKTTLLLSDTSKHDVIPIITKVIMVHCVPMLSLFKRGLKTGLSRKQTQLFSISYQIAFLSIIPIMESWIQNLFFLTNYGKHLDIFFQILQTHETFIMQKSISFLPPSYTIRYLSCMCIA